MKTLSFALIIVGLVLAPAYWIYAKFYTGTQLNELPLTEASPAANGPKTWQTASFSLTEAAAPVGLILIAQGHFSPNMDESRPPKNAYTATLHRDTEAGKPLGFTLGVKHVTDSNPAFHEHLLLMNKVTPGQYHLRVEEKSPPEIQINKMSLQVRQNLHEPDPRVVTGGILAFILGILMLVVS